MDVIDLADIVGDPAVPGKMLQDHREMLDSIKRLLLKGPHRRKDYRDLLESMLALYMENPDFIKNPPAFELGSEENSEDELEYNYMADLNSEEEEEQGILRMAHHTAKTEHKPL